MAWGQREVLRATKSDSGAAAVEFAIVCPLLIYFLITVLYFGLYIGIAHSVQQLAADSARASIAGLGDPERRQLTIDYVSAAAPGYFGIESDYLEVDYEPSASNAGRVTLTYDASSYLSWYPQSFIPLLDTTITRDAVVRTGGF
jgi:Flp pilus assembly protein TadG